MDPGPTTRVKGLHGRGHDFLVLMGAASRQQITGLFNNGQSIDAIGEYPALSGNLAYRKRLNIPGGESCGSYRGKAYLGSLVTLLTDKVPCIECCFII